MDGLDIDLYEDGSIADNFGSGTLNNQQPQGNKASADDIINASANGLDSVTGLVSLFLNKDNPNASPQNNNMPPPPPPRKQPNPWLIGGIVGGVLFLILFLIYMKNGSKQ